MDCERFREALSADLDDELDPTSRADAVAHLRDCTSCRAHELALVRLHRAVRVRAADPVPDLAAGIMAEVQLPARDSWPGWTSVALLMVGVAQMVLALPPLLLGHDAGAPVHVARELGSLNIALAAGLLLAAWQPRRISGLLPVASALAIAMVATALADIASGRAAPLPESYHLLDLLGLLFLWLAGRRERPSVREPLVRLGSLGPRPA